MQMPCSHVPMNDVSAARRMNLIRYWRS